jgi:adenine-specific DNA-methyltransferase
MVKTSFEKNLEVLLKSNPDFISTEGEILKDRVIDSAYKADKKLIELLLDNPETKKKFFSEIKKHWVFNINDFVMFVQDKHFLNDSYTKYKNKIGLTIDGKFLNERKEVALVWPFKDTVLEGGMTKEDQKKKEIFFNEILAQDEIDKLLAPKVLTNWKRHTAKGEEEVKELKRDENGTIKENLIIKGNNLLALHTLKEQFRGKVKLIYIDPPFNTGNDGFNYNDSFGHSTWMTFMKNRLEIARELLSKDGNIFVHLDINESHYLKILCDDVFGRENFVEEIIWSYGSASGGRAAGAKPVNIHDYILHYSKNYSERKQNKVYTPYSEKYIKEWFKYADKDGRLYRRRMRGRDADGNTEWEKQYLDESKGVPLTTVWNDIKQVYADPRAYKENQSQHTELLREFSGQKPEALIARILEMASDELDLILDFHLGTGTTCAVAHKMKRKYIGIEQLDHLEDFAIKRIKNVVSGDKNGISKDVNWKGGGDFVYCELMKYNEDFVEQIENAKDTKAILKIWEQMKGKAFFKHNFEMQEFEKNIEEFKKLDLEKQKQVLFSVLDKNQLYVNYSEIEDKKFKVEKKDKEINKEFYGE